MTAPKKRRRGPWVVVETLNYEYEGREVQQLWVFRTRKGAENFHNRMVREVGLPSAGTNPSTDYDTYEAALP